MAPTGAMMTLKKLQQNITGSQRKLKSSLQSKKQSLENRQFGSATAPPASGASMAVLPPEDEDREADAGESHCAEPSGPPTASTAYDAGTFEMHNGEYYPKKKAPGWHNINCGYSLKDITYYVTAVAPRVLASADKTNEHLPCHSSADYTTTIYEATQSRPDPKFTFANHSKTVSYTHLTLPTSYPV